MIFVLKLYQFFSFDIMNCVKIFFIQKILRYFTIFLIYDTRNIYLTVQFFKRKMVNYIRYKTKFYTINKYSIEKVNCNNYNKLSSIKITIYFVELP